MKRSMGLLLGFVVLTVTLTAGASEELAKSKGCLNCHALDSKRIGPAYGDVAKKYAGQAEAESKLAYKIIQGGSGTWGTLPMPPNPGVTPEEAQQLARWILNLK